jgi:predicted  nucleic acid-binding Zn-ribbon protein
MLSMSEDDTIRDRFQSRGEKAASDLAQALIGSPAFGQAVSAAVTAREKAGEAQRAAMGALNVSSQDEADRLERRLRVLSERLEESEDRLDLALGEIRELNGEIASLRGALEEEEAKRPARKRSRTPKKSGADS